MVENGDQLIATKTGNPSAVLAEIERWADFDSSQITAAMNALVIFDEWGLLTETGTGFLYEILENLESRRK